jgi:DNA repair exonuclease SbcCD ATPase subunit
MKIVELNAENFKKLKIKQVIDGSVITVKGKNGLGKTSVIDALWIALTGQNIPDVPIKTGEDEGFVEAVIERDDKTRVTVQRKFKGDKVSLMVKSDEGARYSSPQKFLDELIGEISFDPFEFINMQPTKQKQFLMELLGINLTEIDAKRRGALDKVDEKKKKIVSLEVELKNYESVERVDEVDTSVLIEELSDLNKRKSDFDALMNKEGDIQARYNLHNKSMTDLASEIGRLQDKMKGLIDGSKDIENEAQAHKQLIESFERVTDTDIFAKNEEIRTAGDTNKKAAKFKEKVEKEDLLKTAISEREEAQKKVNTLASERVQLISSAKMPIDKLEFGDDGLIFEGLPFTEEQLSKAKILQIGIAISIALNPKLRIMRVKDGSLLDDESLETIKGLAIDNQYQLFIERVTNDKELGFIIE